MVSDSAAAGKRTVVRIGILARSDLVFQNWELRLFERIANDPRFEIVALIVDGRVPVTTRTGWLAKLTTDKPINRLMWRLCQALDRRAAREHLRVPAPKFTALQSRITKVLVTPQSLKFVDHFSDADSAAVKDLGLDVLLRHGFGIIKGQILTAAWHGIWSFHHADNRVNRGMPAGFWEAALGEPVTGATLQVLTPELDGGRVIGRCAQNTIANAQRNQRAIYELSVSLIWRELQKLARKSTVATTPSLVYSGPLYTNPTALQSTGYIIRRLASVAKGIGRKLSARAGRRPSMWSLAVGNTPFEQTALWRTRETMPPPNRFWADPFLLQRDDGLYVFFEEFDYALQRGWISAGRVVGQTIEYLGAVIDAGYHMSFPFVFQHDGQIFMIPETGVKRRVELWRAVEFPTRWTLERTAFEGTDIADTTLFEFDGRWWLFANISQTPDVDFCNELHVFAVDGPGLKTIVPHQDNPVVIDSRFARNGGRPYIRDGRLYRPSQSNIGGVYGRGLNVMEVTALSLTAYEERLACSATPEFRPGLVGIHHLDATGGTFIIDTCRANGGRGT